MILAGLVVVLGLLVVARTIALGVGGGLGLLIGGLMVARRGPAHLPGRGDVAKPLTDTTRRLRARSLGLVAYGEIGSSLIFALGHRGPVRATALTPWVLLAVGLLVLVVTLSYAEGSTAMPEAGGAATFVRRAFSDPLGFVTGWALFLDYLVVIAITALFVPHYLGGALGWDGITDKPWDAVVGIAVIGALAVVRRIRRIRLYAVAVVMAGVAVVAQLSLAVLGFALVLVSRTRSPSASTSAPRPRGRRSRWPCRWPRSPTRGSRPSTNFAAEVREPGRTMPRTLFLGIGAVVVLNVAVSMVGVSAYPVEPAAGAPDGVAGGLATEWLQAPLLGIATAIGDELPGGGGLVRGGDRRLRGPHPDHGDGDRHGRGRAPRVLDGPLRHAAPRVRPARAGRVAHAARPPWPRRSSPRC